MSQAIAAPLRQINPLVGLMLVLSRIMQALYAVLATVAGVPIRVSARVSKASRREKVILRIIAIFAIALIIVAFFALGDANAANGIKRANGLNRANGI